MGCKKKHLPAAQRLGLHPDSVGWRVRHGWSEERAITELRRNGRKKLSKVPETWTLNRIEFGPTGFTCPCGSEQFDKPKHRTFRKEWKCLGCGLTYIFVGAK